MQVGLPIARRPQIRGCSSRADVRMNTHHSATEDVDAILVENQRFEVSDHSRCGYDGAATVHSLSCALTWVCGSRGSQTMNRGVAEEEEEHKKRW